MNESEIVLSLSAIANIHRLRVFRALVKAGQAGLTPSSIAAQLKVAPNALSFHLKELAHAGLVEVESKGRNLIYRTNFSAMNGLIGYLVEACCAGGTCDISYPTIKGLSVSHTKPINVLFLCTHNSARSIIAEALLNDLGKGRFNAYSAGSSPRLNQQPNPMALEILRQSGIAISGLHSKSWDVFATADAPAMDLVITVCDNAAGEVCPYWPGQPATAHWGYPDPSEVTGQEETKREAFRQTLHAVRRRLDLLLSLPHDRLGQLMLQQTARDLATQ